MMREREGYIDDKVTAGAAITRLNLNASDDTLKRMDTRYLSR